MTPFLLLSVIIPIILLILNADFSNAKSHSISHIEYERLKFLNTFDKTCKTYKFYNTYLESLKNPRSKHVVFVMQEKGFKNGGFGDRLAGLVHAAAIALMTNRTLLIQADNEFGFHRLFRPYAPDINTKYAYSDSPDTNDWKKNDTDVPYTLEWGPKAWAYTGFNPNFRDNDNTEYDLYFCINNGGGGRARQCGMFDGDVPQPIIKFRSNRAYLCRIDKDPSLASFNLLRNVLGVPENANLFEVAGCLLRLVMWPTEELWGYIDDLLDSHKKDLIRKGIIPSGAVQNGWQHTISLQYRCGDISWSSRAGEACVAVQGTDYTTNKNDYRSAGTPLEEAICAKKSINSLANSRVNMKDVVEGDMLLAHLADLLEKNIITQQEYQDLINAINQKNKATTNPIVDKGSENPLPPIPPQANSSANSNYQPKIPWDKFIEEYWKKFDEPQAGGATSTSASSSSSAKPATPWEQFVEKHFKPPKRRALRAKGSSEARASTRDSMSLRTSLDVYHNTNTLLHTIVSYFDDMLSTSISNRFYTSNRNNHNIKISRSNYRKRKLDNKAVAQGSNVNVFAYMTSDSPYSLTQMNETLGWPNTLLSPPGCHLEWVSTFDCLKTTVIDWFLLAISDIVITQSDDNFDKFNSPTSTPKSAYSRYAAVYGLIPDSIRDSKICAKTNATADGSKSDYKIFDSATLSHVHQGNWWCNT